MRFGLILSEAFTGLRRNASMVISVILVTFVSLTFVGAAMLMQMQIGKMQSYWSDRAQVSVFMCATSSNAPTCTAGEAATQEQIDQVRATLDGSALAPLIRDYTFLTSDEVFENAKQQLPDDIVGVVTADQFNATFNINLVDQSQSDVIAEAFSGQVGVESVDDQLQYLEPLFQALTVATYVAVGIAGLMLIAAVLLIATTIRCRPSPDAANSASCASWAPRTASSRRRSSSRASWRPSSAPRWPVSRSGRSSASASTSTCGGASRSSPRGSTSATWRSSSR